MNIREKANTLPDNPGVYIMKSKKGKVLYVGKATSLRKRVRSYFLSNTSSKTEMLMENVYDIEFINCDSPQQALILEAALIKERKPKYNISLRDSKTYPYIEVTRERIPRIFVSRPKQKSKSLLFGPYPKAKLLKPALNMIRKVFPYCSCRSNPKKECLFYHIDLCPAPCAGKISLSDYKENIKNICKILKGERKQLVRKLEKKMKNFSDKKEFEQALKIRDKLQAIENLYKGAPREHQMLSLKKALDLKKIPLVIEAVDISSLGGRDSVGSLVVFRDGVADKASYRRFKIKTAKSNDDYAMIQEVLFRRYTRILKQDKALPDLVIVDGGKGHVVKAKEVFERLKINPALIGIAKQHEEIWFADRDVPLRIESNKPSLHLIQKIRDEAHRFAHSYQLKRRSMKIRTRHKTSDNRPGVN